ncbi:MAG: hypothetical protein HC844_17370 [Tabrizicola sp.]|nr:hypothetical protein [Tabrizicola sp.]
MTADQFEAHIGTRTLTYDYGEGVRGTAEHLPERRLRWAFEGYPCIEGSWYARRDMICFVFSDPGASACWHFYDLDGRIRGRSYLDDGMMFEILEIARTDAPLSCHGAEVGV